MSSNGEHSTVPMGPTFAPADPRTPATAQKRQKKKVKSDATYFFCIPIDGDLSVDPGSGGYEGTVHPAVFMELVTALPLEICAPLMGASDTSLRRMLRRDAHFRQPLGALLQRDDGKETLGAYIQRFIRDQDDRSIALGQWILNLEHVSHWRSFHQTLNR